MLIKACLAVIITINEMKLTKDSLYRLFLGRPKASVFIIIIPGHLNLPCEL